MTADGLARLRAHRAGADDWGVPLALLRRPVITLVLAVSLLTPAIAGSAPDVILVGDSVTAGWGASENDRAWPSLLRSGVTVDAIAGATSAAFLGRSWSARTVVIELGINDYAQSVPASAYGADVRLLVNSVHANRVVLVVPYLVAVDRAARSWNSYADELTSIARVDPRVVVVDLRTAFGPPSTWLLASDLIHPNDRGHAVIAHLVAEAIAIRETGSSHPPRIAREEATSRVPCRTTVQA